MLRSARAMAGKDLRLILGGGVGLAQPVLLGLLLIFLFSLSRPAGELVPPQAAAGIFWLASLFAQVLVFNTLYALEEGEGARMGLLLSPAPVHAVWLGKALAGLLLLLVSQAVFAPAAVVFLGQNLGGAGGGGAGTALVALVLVDWGMVVLGSLLGALAQGQAARESLLSLIVFPLLIPVLLAGVRIWGDFFGGGFPGHVPAGDSAGWLGLAGAFGAVFTGAAMILFPFVYTGED